MEASAGQDTGTASTIPPANALVDTPVGDNMVATLGETANETRDETKDSRPIEAPIDKDERPKGHQHEREGASPPQKKCTYRLFFLVVLVLVALVGAGLIGWAVKKAGGDGDKEINQPDEPSPGEGVDTTLSADRIEVVTGTPLEEGQDFESLEGVEEPAVDGSGDSSMFVTMGPDGEPPYSEYIIYFPAVVATGESEITGLTLTTSIQLSLGTEVPWNVGVKTFDSVEVAPLDMGDLVDFAWEFMGDFSQVHLSEWTQVKHALTPPEPFSRYVSPAGDIEIRIYSNSSQPCYLDAASISVEYLGEESVMPTTPPEPTPTIPPTPVVTPAPMVVTLPTVEPQRWSAFAQFVPDWEAWEELHGNNICDPMESCRTDPACCSDTEAVCGNGLCEDTENGGSGMSSCPMDCTHYLFSCGDGVCESGESTYHAFR
ncbi:unnamed protein product [Discosporangium mesarthrocarpum]